MEPRMSNEKDKFAAAPTPPVSEDRKCKCSMRTRMLGDGCSVCNPALAAELREERAEEDRKDAERFQFLMDDHEEKATRQKVRELFERLPVMSLSGARQAIDAAIQEDKP